MRGLLFRFVERNCKKLQSADWRNYGGHVFGRPNTSPLRGNVELPERPQGVAHDVGGQVVAVVGQAFIEPLRPQGVSHAVGAHAGAVVSHVFRLPLKPQFEGGHDVVVLTQQLAHEHAEPDDATQPPQSHQITRKTTRRTATKPRT